MTKKIIAAAVIALFAGAAGAGDVFTTLDTDKSGAISQEEASVIPSVAGQWEALDADADGELSAEELANYKAAESASM